MGITAGAPALLLIAICVASAPSCAQESVHSTRSGADLSVRACLNQKERRSLIESGAVVHLANAMHAVRGRVPGTLIRARLCRRGDSLDYVLTVLAHDGKVTRVVVDAAKGTLVGER
jgi:uncharacterized membrane protein YkoI